jgi:hypothetical protein
MAMSKDDDYLRHCQNVGQQEQINVLCILMSVDKFSSSVQKIVNQKVIELDLEKSVAFYVTFVHHFLQIASESSAELNEKLNANWWLC